MLPIYDGSGDIVLSPSNDKFLLSEERYKKRVAVFDNINKVLTQVIPGLTINLKEISKDLTKDGEMGHVVRFMACRNGKETPICFESDGVRRIISMLALIVLAYNNPSVTLVIDEFDAGIYEYLIGEILQSFEESGKGQLIFTSHNLRPLELINKKFIVFTTTNPDNRYYRFKGLTSTSNLRDSYLREIIIGEQDEELYTETRMFEIESAMRKAGKESNEDAEN